MAGFRKAKAEQAAIKMGLYGPSGSGKTFTALLIAEGLAKVTHKRIAFVDTERGTDFYCKDVPARKIHPEAFDFDALYTKSITEILTALKSLNPAEYGVVVIDSITHVWEAARLAYSGPETKAGTIPFHAWGKIKKPYKELINLLLSSPMHVMFCGRQGNEFQEDEESGELKRVGVKMKAEGETPYEPHILLRMEAVKNAKAKESVITAFAEKDRTGVLAGQTIAWPKFDNIVKPLLPLLGGKQAHIQDDDETARQDAEKLSADEKHRITESTRMLAKFQARFHLCENSDDLKQISKEITADLKKKMVTADVAVLRESYLEAETALKGKRKPQETQESLIDTKTQDVSEVSPTGGTGPVQAISDKTLSAIWLELKRTQYEEEILRQDYEVSALMELSEEAGQNVLKFLAGQPDV